MSSALTWHILRHNHSFLVKRDSHTFSAEANNLYNKHSPRFTGFQTKTVGVTANKDGKISLVLRNKKAKNKPSKSNVVVPLNRHTVNGGSFAAGTIRSLTAKSHYRADLTNFAIARYHALRKATQIKKTNPRKTQRKPRSRKAAA